MEATSYPVAATTAVIGALALVWFVRRQRCSTAPLIDLTLFDNRDFRLAVVVALVSSFSIVGLGLVLSQRQQLVLGNSPLHAALLLLPTSLMAIIGGPLAGWLAPRCGVGYVTAGALLLGGLGEAGLLLTSNGGPAPQILCLSVFGLGSARRSRPPHSPS